MFGIIKNIILDYIVVTIFLVSTVLGYRYKKGKYGKFELKNGENGNQKVFNNIANDLYNEISYTYKYPYYLISEFIMKRVDISQNTTFSHDKKE